MSRGVGPGPQRDRAIAPAPANAHDTSRSINTLARGAPASNASHVIPRPTTTITTHQASGSSSTLGRVLTVRS